MRPLLTLTFIMIALTATPAACNELNARFNKIFSDTGEVPAGLITGMVQDSLGFVWLGGSEGIKRYDGHRFLTIDTPNYDLSDIYVTAMKRDPEGPIWVATTNGLISVNPETLEVEKITAPSPSGVHLSTLTVISDIEITQNSSIVVATDKGVFEISKNRVIVEKLQLPEHSVTSLAVDPNNNLWVAYDSELIVFYNRNTNALTEYKIKPIHDGHGCSGRPLTIHLTKENEVFLGTMGSGICTFDWSTQAFVKYEPNLNIHTVWDIADDSDGTIWMATDGDGLIKINSSGTSQIKQDKTRSDSIGSNQLRALLIDNRNDVWVSLFPEGVELLDRSLESIKVFNSSSTPKSSLPHNAVISIEGNDAYIWIGTEDGLTRLDKSTNTTTHFPIPNLYKRNGHNRDTILSLKIYDDNLLVGTWSHGLLVLDTLSNQWRTFADYIGNEAVNSDRYIWTIAISQKGHIWYGTENRGAVKYDRHSKSLKRYQTTGSTSSIPSNFVRSLLVDRDDRVWIGTNNGMAVYVPTRNDVIRYPPQTHHLEFYGTRITSLFQNENGAIWIGTQDGGISKLNTRSYWFETKTKDHGLPSNSISSITQDSDSNMWVGSTGGVAILNSKGQLIHVLGRNQGLIGQTINRNAVYHDDDNTVWIGTTAGLNAINPTGITANTFNHKIPIHVTSVLINETPVTNLRETKTVPYDQNTVKFRYSLLAFRASDRYQYEYRLIGGTNESWQNVNAPSVTFPNLKSGKYVFEVSAVYQNGLRVTSAPFIFKIEPPWYASYISLIAYVLIFCFLVYGIYLYQVKRIQLNAQIRINERMKSLDKAKDTFLANTSHELRTPVAAMVGLAETINEPSNDENKVGTIISTGKRLLILINDILDYSKMMHGNVVMNMVNIPLHRTVNEVFAILSLHANDKAIDLINDIPKDVLIKADQNRLTQILINIVTNAIKYSGGTTIRISLENSSNEKSLIIDDDGIGIAESKKASIFEPYTQTDESSSEHATGTGLGLTITRMLVNAQGGKITFNSRINEGTRFEIRGFKLTEAKVDERNAYGLAESVVAPNFDYTRYNILVVDDDPTNRMIVNAFLAKKGFNVDTAKCGREAVKKLKQQEFVPDIVLMDMHMPFMDGFETERVIRAQDMEHDIPTLFLSAAKISASKAAQNGHDIADFFLKPVDKENIISRIEFYLKRRVKLK